MVGLVKNLYFLNRSKYSFRPYAYGGLSGEKQIAVPRYGRGSSYIIKGNNRECACNEFIGLRLAKMLGAYVPDAYLVEPKENMYEVAIEYLEPMPNLILIGLKLRRICFMNMSTDSLLTVY